MTSSPPLAAAANPVRSDPLPGTAPIPLTGAWWEHTEILLVADRQRGSTHKFFHNWRVEVVAGAEQAAPGSVLVSIPMSQQGLVDSGWQYQLQRHAPVVASRRWTRQRSPG